MDKWSFAVTKGYIDQEDGDNSNTSGTWIGIRYAGIKGYNRFSKKMNVYLAAKFRQLAKDKTYISRVLDRAEKLANANRAMLGAALIRNRRMARQLQSLRIQYPDILEKLEQEVPPSDLFYSLDRQEILINALKIIVKERENNPKLNFKVKYERGNEVAGETIEETLIGSHSAAIGEKESNLMGRWEVKDVGNEYGQNHVTVLFTPFIYPNEKLSIIFVNGESQTNVKIVNVPATKIINSIWAKQIKKILSQRIDYQKVVINIIIVIVAAAFIALVITHPVPKYINKDELTVSLKIAQSETNDYQKAYSDLMKLIETCDELLHGNNANYYESQFKNYEQAGLFVLGIKKEAEESATEIRQKHNLPLTNAVVPTKNKAMMATPGHLVLHPSVFGGIDFNSAHLKLKVKRDGNGVPLPLAQQDMAQINSLEGLEPVLLQIRPALGSPLLSELTK